MSRSLALKMCYMIGSTSPTKRFISGRLLSDTEAQHKGMIKSWLSAWARQSPIFKHTLTQQPQARNNK